MPLPNTWQAGSRRRSRCHHYSTFAVPFRWMLTQYREEIEDAGFLRRCQPEEKAPFPTPWVFSRERQIPISEGLGRLAAKQSLVFFYTKSGHPLDEGINRLVVGVGQIEWLFASVRMPKLPSGRVIPFGIASSHIPSASDGWNGMLLPYHEYQEPTEQNAVAHHQVGRLRRRDRER